MLFRGEGFATASAGWVELGRASVVFIGVGTGRRGVVCGTRIGVEDMIGTAGGNPEVSGGVTSEGLGGRPVGGGAIGVRSPAFLDGGFCNSLLYCLRPIYSRYGSNRRRRHHKNLATHDRLCGCLGVHLSFEAVPLDGRQAA